MVQKRVECLDKIEQFIRETKKHFPVEAVYLFGSQTTDKARKDSDVDLVVVSEIFETMEPLDRLVLLGRIAWKAQTPEIEAIGYTHREFFDASPWEFASGIRSLGVPVLF